MSVLSDTSLHLLGPSVVDPFDPVMVQPASIDLRLGHEFVSFRMDIDEIDLANVRRSGFPLHVENGYLLDPGEFVLGCTVERLDIPTGLVGRIEGKSSIGRLGLMVHVTAGFIDPGFNGRITLEMANLRTVPMILRPGLAICQLSLSELDEPAARPYTGRYQGDESAEPSRYGASQTHPREWEADPH